MKHFVYFFICVITLLPSPVSAQKESAIWYFGDQAGLDFNFTPPVAISNPNMKTLEGCSSLADTSGKLLFYSDGRTVWNKQHAVMENGTGLLGDASSTHSSVFIQKPYSSNEYYIITADDWPDLTGNPNKGVNYSEISLNYNAGIGKVTSKNNPLVKYSAEKIGIAKHRNGAYFWLAIPECFTSNLHLFLITENGFEKKAVYTNLFPALMSSWGQIKFSQDGQHLALTWPQPNNSQKSDVLVLDFNNVNGTLNPSQVISTGDNLYGVEFSPNSKYLYLSTWLNKNKVCQCPVVQGTTDYLTGCKFYPQRYESGQLQLGPDQKIYIANNSQRYVGVIEYPDSDFAQSGFIDSAIALLPNTKCLAGLPSLYVLTERLSATNICVFDTGKFSISTNNLPYDSIHWFVNTTKLPETQTSAAYYFSAPGVYEISAVLFYPLKTDTFSKSINVKRLPIDPNLQDTFICQNEAAMINAYREVNVFYEWSTGSTDSVISLSQAGFYQVKLTLNGCSITNNFLLTDKPDPIVNMPEETIICEGSSVLMSAAQPGATYLWSTGSTDSAVFISNDQTYWVTVTLSGCTATDTFALHTTNLATTDLGIDTSICDGQTFELNVYHPYSTYLWNTTSTESVISIKSPGLYTVTVTNPCGTVYDTVKIDQAICNCFAWTPNAFTPNGDSDNDLFIPQLSCAYSDFDFRIYNKWGTEVFHSTSPTTAWNGRYKDEAMPCDVYVWKLTCSLIHSRGMILPQNLNGTVTLLR